MIRGRWARLLLLAAPLLLAGCSNFWQAPSSSGGGGCTTNCTTASSGNFYILNAGATPQVVGESIVSGTLTAISGSPWTLLGTPYAMAIAPNGSALFISTTSGVLAYPISGGQLGTATQVSTDTSAYAVQVDSTNSWLIEAIQGAGGVMLGAVPISSTTGAAAGLEQTVSFPISNAALKQNQLAISPDNSNIFVPMGSGGTIVVPFNATVANGANPFGSTATTIPVLNTGGSALSVAVDPANRLFYIGETLANSSGNSGGLRAFNYSSLGSSTLTQASGSPAASGGLAPNFILPLSSGGYIYIANGAGTGSSGNIAGFPITSSGTAYTIGAGSTISTGTQPYGLAEDSTKTFILAVSALGGPYLSTYTFDSTTPGKLDAQIIANTGASPLAIVAAQ